MTSDSGHPSHGQADALSGATPANGTSDGPARPTTNGLFTRFFRCADLGLAITRPDATFEAVNPTLCRMLGRTEHELKETNWQTLTHPDDLDRDLSLFNRVLVGGIDSYELQKRFLRNDGSTLHAQMTLAVERDEAGTPQRFFATILDRGAEQTALEALHLSERRFRLLTESTLDGVWDWDIAGNTLWLSPSWKAQLGYSDEELENSFATWDKLLHPEDHPRVMGHLQNYLADPSAIWQETFRLRHREGGWRQILARAIPVFGDSGPPIQMVGVHIDITAEREALSELRALSQDLEQRLKRRTEQVKAAQHELEDERLFVQVILNTARALILVLDSQAQIVSVNPYIETVLGWEPKHLVGKNWITTCLPEAARAPVRAVFHRAFTEERTQGYENQVLARDGTVRYVRWYDDVIRDDTDQPCFLVAVGIDVTDELKASQALAKLNQQLENKVRERTRTLEAAQATMIQNEKMASLGTMVAGISHEINNPLMALTNYVDYARDKTDGRVHDILDKAAGQSRRIGDIVNGLLNFSHPSNTQLGQIDIAASLNSAVALIHADLREHGIDLGNRVPADLPPAIAESGALQQVFLNLLTNARDALLGTTERRIELRGGTLDRTVWVEIADSGPGIPAANRDRVFDPFFTTKQPGKGTGLGLSVSQGIIHALGGTLTLQAPDAHGAVFRVSVPRAHQAEPQLTAD